MIGLTKDDVPADLKKKVTLLIYFGQYMDEHLIYGAEVHADKRQSNCGPSLTSCAAGIFMKKWFRTDRAIVMHLSNGTLQVSHAVFWVPPKIRPCTHGPALPFICQANCGQNFTVHSENRYLRNVTWVRILVSRNHNPKLFFAVGQA